MLRLWPDCDWVQPNVRLISLLLSWSSSGCLIMTFAAQTITTSAANCLSLLVVVADIALIASLPIATAWCCHRPQQATQNMNMSTMAALQTQIWISLLGWVISILNTCQACSKLNSRQSSTSTGVGVASIFVFCFFPSIVGYTCTLLLSSLMMCPRLHRINPTHNPTTNALKNRTTSMDHVTCEASSWKHCELLVLIIH